MDEPDQPAGSRAETTCPAQVGLFVVERRLPRTDAHQLAVLQAALAGATSRLSTRGSCVRYLRSVFLARQARLLSFFTADSIEAVSAVNEASLVPFTNIEPAVDLPIPPP